MEPVAYASINIKEIKTGTITDNKGNFKLQLEAAKYVVAVTMMGYKAVILTIVMTKDYTLTSLEVAGGGILYVPERNLKYVEVFFGVEKVIRFWRDRYKVGGYIISSVANKFTNPIQFKIGIEIFNKRKNSWY